jgi:rhamnogalacturonyl hydrolase YesR
MWHIWKHAAGLLTGLMIAACVHDPGPQAETHPAEIGALVAIDYLSREEIMMYEVGDVVAPHYAEAATAYGMARLGGLTHWEEFVSAATLRHRRILDEAIPNSRNHVDANVYGVWPLEIYLQTGDKAALDYGWALAEEQWDETGADGLTTQARYWIDDVWMIGALQAQAFRATGDNIHADRAALMAVAYIDRLQQPGGLFHHGPDAPFYWARGNGWVAAGLAEVISILPEEHPDRARVLEGYAKMMDALVEYQAESGMWRQLIDYPGAWEESSGTAMFGFALRVGVREGILEDPKYRAAYERAWSALVDKVGADGRLADVCVGTGQSDDAQYYLDRPNVTGDLHGQAPLLWFATALLQPE